MNDGVIKSDLKFIDHTEELVHVTSQPTEDLILDRNAELRKNKGAIMDLGAKGKGGTWGRQVASIPFILYHKAIRDGYQLNSPDKQIMQQEMNRFLRSEDGKKCLI